MDPEFLKQFNELVEETKSIKAIVSDSNAKVDAIAKQIHELKSENEELRAKVDIISQENKTLKRTVNDLEQYSRKCNVIINGIPEFDNENLYEITHMVADNLGVELFDYDISVAHRLPAAEDKIPAIIVKLNSLEKKAQLVQNSKKVKLHGSKIGINPGHPIFVGDQLTPHTAVILKKAKALKKSNDIEFVWYRNGSVFTRKTENDPAIKITDIAQLPEPSGQLNIRKESEETQGSSQQIEQGNPSIESVKEKRGGRNLRTKSQSRQPTLEQLRKYTSSSGKKNRITIANK